MAPPLYVVDVFAREPYTGNRVAVATDVEVGSVVPVVHGELLQGDVR